MGVLLPAPDIVEMWCVKFSGLTLTWDVMIEDKLRIEDCKCETLDLSGCVLSRFDKIELVNMPNVKTIIGLNDSVREFCHYTIENCPNFVTPVGIPDKSITIK